MTPYTATNKYQKYKSVELGDQLGLASQTHETVIWQMLWLGLKRMEPVLISTGAGCYINFVSSFEFSTGTGFYTKPFFHLKMPG